MAQKLEMQELDNVSGGGCEKEPEEVTMTLTITYRKEAPVTSQSFDEVVTFTFPSVPAISEIQNKCREWCKERNYYYGHFITGSN